MYYDNSRLDFDLILFDLRCFTVNNDLNSITNNVITKNRSHFFLFVREFLLQIMNVVFAMGNLEFKISSVMLLETTMIDGFFQSVVQQLIARAFCNKLGKALYSAFFCFYGFLLFSFILFSFHAWNKIRSSLKISTNFANLFEQQKQGRQLKAFWFHGKETKQKKSKTKYHNMNKNALRNFNNNL